MSAQTQTDLIRKLREQRRRNAKTIRARNEAIRNLEWKLEQFKEIAEDRKFIIGVLQALIEDKKAWPNE